MLRKKSVTILAIITSVIVLAFTTQTAIFADSITFGYSGGNYREHYYGGNKKLTSEKRDGYLVDDWIERGSSSVTNSPKYRDGVRLATWADRYDDEYDYGLASAVYLFDVPDRARSAKIKVKYDGNRGRYSDDDNIVGRLWIKSRNNYANYDRYDDNRALYGDTFILRGNRNKEEITISTDEHVIDGVMEIHIIAEGGQLLDVDYIEVETYRAFPNVRIITKEYEISRPWYNNTYLYFYAGPIFHFGHGHYVRYTYVNTRHLVKVRRQYGSYLQEFHNRHPQMKFYWSGRLHFPKFREKDADRVWLDRWTSDHERTRKSYATAPKKSHKSSEMKDVKDQVRRIIVERRNPSQKNAEKYERKREKEEAKWLKKEYRDKDDDRDNERENKHGHFRNR